jgi:hypothetical protein
MEHLAVPVQPVLEGDRPYAMFKDYWKYDWVLAVHRYEGLPSLLATLAEKVIAPAEKNERSGREAAKVRGRTYSIDTDLAAVTALIRSHRAELAAVAAEIRAIEQTGSPRPAPRPAALRAGKARSGSSSGAQAAAGGQKRQIGRPTAQNRQSRPRGS